MAIKQAEPTEQFEQMQLKRRLFTLDEYKRIIEAGIFPEDEHLELIGGEILKMPPIGFDHGNGVSNLIIVLTAQVGKSARPWVQSPVQLPNNTQPEPDFALLKQQEYGKQKPVTPSDVILIVEVSDTTLKYDREVKGPLYAGADIPEYWIVNLPDQIIEVYTNPEGGEYKHIRKARHDETLALPEGLGEAVQVSDILGRKDAT
jgi:Uma2 family endonuclease